MIPIGTVLHLFCERTTPSKYKYLVVVCCKPELRLFYINSEISRFDTGNFRLNSCNVEISTTNHPFLKKNSYVRCCEFSNEFDLEEILASSMTSNIMVGTVSKDILFEILQAVKTTPLITESEKNLLLIL